MPRSQSLKEAQKRYREKNREAHNATNLKCRMNRYYMTKNYKDVDNMAKSFYLLYGY